MENNSYFTTINSNGGEDNPVRLTVILACFGNIQVIEKPLEETVECLNQVKENIRLILVTDGIQYSEISIVQKIRNQFSNAKVISLDKDTHTPAELFNVALAYIDTSYISFAWAGSYFDERIKEFSKNPNMNFPVYAIKNSYSCKIPVDPNPSLVYGWSQCTKLYDLNNVIVSSKALNEVGGFDQSPFLQKNFGWEWLLRLSKYFIFTPIGTVAVSNTMNLENYPFNKHFNFDEDTIHRYLLRSRLIPYRQNIGSMSETEICFIKDLPREDVEKVKDILVRNGLETYVKVPRTWFPQLKKRYKITIVGGYWEYHHNQLSFFNYFDKLYGKGFATYKVLLDAITAPQDVVGSDLVIITRSRNPNILAVINKCREEQIASLYMIDDNWFSVAKDLPETYGQLFIQGNPQFDTFIEAIKKCDAVITYNTFIHEEISKYNKNVILFPLNIDLDFYTQDQETQSDRYKSNEIIIGYTGSLRHDDTAFKALSNIARKHDCVKVLLFGGISESQRLLFEGLDTNILNHMPYPIYCNVIKHISPDILIAPLVKNKTSMSKCPNKYLEAGAVKAAGIYTNIYPYNDIVKDGVTGLLVDDNTVEAWEQKILLLVNDKRLMTKIKEQCHNDVRKYYSTEKYIGKLCKMIKALIKNKYRKGGNAE